MTLEEFNGEDARAARDALLACCRSVPWADAMLAERPFATTADLHSAADRLWDMLPPDEWRSAFAAHPRIGERSTEPDSRAAGWSVREQEAASAADDGTRTAMTRANRDYEELFGFRYLVFASGRSAQELLADCTARLRNDPETELKLAAAEHLRISRLRLSRLLGQDGS